MEDFMRPLFALGFLALGAMLLVYTAQTPKRTKEYDDGPNIVGFLAQPVLGLAAGFGGVIALVASAVIFFT